MVDFARLCEVLVTNWDFTCKNILRQCHDTYPSTDVIYALAQRITDPTNKHMVDFPWFKIIHNKQKINRLDFVADNDTYLMPVEVDGKIIHGGHALTRPLHYVNKKYKEKLNVRTY